MKSVALQSGVALKLISLLLIFGGAAGVAIALWAEAGTASISHLAFIALAVLVFMWSVWVGIDLWRGKPHGYTGSKVLFALQIPLITFPGFAYQFYIGSVLGLSFSSAAETKLNLEFQLGSAINLQFSSEIENLIFGVNLVAVFVLIYLIRLSRKQRDRTRHESEAPAVG